jgi:hypothetical protein
VRSVGIDWGTRRASWCALDDLGTLQEGSIPAEQDGLSRAARSHARLGDRRRRKVPKRKAARRLLTAP